MQLQELVPHPLQSPGLIVVGPAEPSPLVQPAQTVEGDAERGQGDGQDIDGLVEPWWQRFAVRQKWQDQMDDGRCQGKDQDVFHPAVELFLEISVLAGATLVVFELIL